MKLLIDWVPLALFALAYWLRDIYAATIVLIVALYAALAFDWLLTRKLNKMLLAGAVVASVLGGFTLALHDPAFIKLKPTIVYGLLALTCLGSHFVGKQVLMERLMHSAMTLPRPVWHRVNFAWALFFAFCAALNYYVAHNYPEATWVRFKLIAFTILPFVFVLAQAPFLARYLQDGITTSTPPP